MSDATERLRIIIETLGADLTAKELKEVAKGLNDTAKAADQAGKDVKDTTTEVTKVGAAAKTAGAGVGGLARELSQGDWRGAAMEFGGLTRLMGGVGIAANVAAVGILAVGVAFFQGYQENKQFNNSLILTGNYAGLVAGQLDGMSAQLARSTNTTVGGARETLQALVSTGKFTGDTLMAAGRAIELVAEYSGRSRADVVADFAKMSEGVTKWAVNQNEKYHFMSVAQYEQIKLLEKQGQAGEAVKLTMEAMATSMGSRIQPALGSLERAWDDVRKAASWAWDSMKGIGRQESVMDRLEAARKLVQSTAYELAQAQRLAPSTAGARQENLDRAQASLRALEYTAARDRRAAVERSMQAQADQSAIAEAEKKGKRTGINRVDPEIEARRRLRSEMSGYSADYEKEVYRLVYMRDKEGLSVERFNEELQKLVFSQPGQVAAAKERADLAKVEADRAKELAKNREAAAAAATKDYQAHEQEIAALLQGNERLEQQIAVVGKTKGEIQELKAARLDHAIAITEEQLAEERKFGFDQQVLEQLQRKIDALKRERDLTRDLGKKEDADEQRKKNEAESKKFSDDLRRDVTDSLQRAFESGKNPAEALASTLASTIKTRLTRALAEAIANPILKPIEQAIGGSGGGLAGWLAGLFKGTGTGIAGPVDEFSLIYGTNHGGGIAGAEATAHRAMNPAVFAGANRFHTGGLVGGEVPIIAKRGEGVFTEGQMKALAPVGATAPQVTVNVHTLPGQTASVQQRQGADGLNIEVIVRQLEEQMADNIAAGSGAIGQAIEGRYNLRTAVA